MEMIEVILLATLNLFSIVIGIILGQKTAAREKITVNPVKIVKEAKEEKKRIQEYNREEQLLQTELANIDNYSGDSKGQKELPR